MKNLPIFLGLSLFFGIACSYAIKHNIHKKIFGEGTVSTFIDESLNNNVNDEQSLFDEDIIGKSAPDFSLPLLGEGTMTLSEYKGKFVMLNFWASWCPPCRAEIPDFVKIQEKYQNKNFTFLGIAIEDKEDVESYASDILINYPTSYGVEPAYKVSAQYGNPNGALPYTLLISPEQKILEKFNGLLTEEKLETVLNKYLVN